MPMGRHLLAALLLLFLPAHAAGRTDPVGEGELIERVEAARQAARPRWSALEIREPEGSSRGNPGFAWAWTTAWADPEEFVPALNEQSRDGPTRSFSDPRWVAIPGFRPDARNGRLWFWDPAGRLLSTAQWTDAPLLEAASTESRQLQGPLCAVLTGLVGPATLRPTRCVFDGEREPDVNLDVPGPPTSSGEPLRTSIGRALERVGGVWRIWLRQRSPRRPSYLEDWRHPRFPPETVIVVEADRGPPPPFTCGKSRDFRGFLDALDAGSTSWSRYYPPSPAIVKAGDPRPPAPPKCPEAEAARAAVRSVAGGPCTFRKLVVAALSPSQGRAAVIPRAMAEEVPRLLRLGQLLGDMRFMHLEATLRACASPGFWTIPFGASSPVGEPLAGKLARRCADEYVRSFPIWEDVARERPLPARWNPGYDKCQLAPPDPRRGAGTPSKGR